MARKTVFKKAEEIVKDGMEKEKLFRFFDATGRGLLDYILLFSQFGVSDAKISALYEEWQDV